MGGGKCHTAVVLVLLRQWHGILVLLSNTLWHVVCVCVLCVPSIRTPIHGTLATYPVTQNRTASSASMQPHPHASPLSARSRGTSTSNGSTRTRGFAADRTNARTCMLSGRRAPPPSPLPRQGRCSRHFVPATLSTTRWTTTASTLCTATRAAQAMCAPTWSPTS